MKNARLALSCTFLMRLQGEVNRDTSGMGPWDRVLEGRFMHRQFLHCKGNCERRAARIQFQRRHALDEWGWELYPESQEETPSD